MYVSRGVKDRHKRAARVDGPANDLGGDVPPTSVARLAECSHVLTYEPGGDDGRA
jgi:hypothetical protein